MTTEAIRKLRQEVRDRIAGNIQFHDDPLASKPPEPEPMPEPECTCATTAYMGMLCVVCMGYS